MKRFFLILIISTVFFAGSDLPKMPFTALIIQFPDEYTENNGVYLQIRINEQKRGWTSWQTVTPDIDINEYDFHKDESENETGEISEVLFQTNPAYGYRFKWASAFSKNQNMPKPKIEPFRYGTEKIVLSRLSASVAIPNFTRIIKREDWGADENLLFTNAEQTGNESNGASSSEFESVETAEDISAEDHEIERIITKDKNGRTYRWPLQYAKDIKFIVIHHTASQKMLDNPEVAIQNIYFYHAVRKKWGDIGYHYLIDPKGNIYEGRNGGDKVIGGHAKPLNKVSAGIAVLGNYNEGEIPAPVMRSLLNLTKFLSKKYGIDPDGSAVYKGETRKNIQGHKDSVATSCPGEFLYRKLFWMREIVNESIHPKKNEIFSHIDGELIVVPPESEKTFEIKIKNLSREIWNGSTTLRLPILPLDFEELEFTQSKDLVTVATLANPPVHTGGTAIFKGAAKSMLASGLKTFTAKVAVNGTKVGATDPPLRISFFIEGVSPNYEVSLRHDPPNKLKPGETFEGFIELKNTGNSVWKNDGKNRIVLAADHPRGRKSVFFESDIMAALEQKTVKPGEIGRFAFKGKAPQSGGSFTEHFTPKVEGIRYLQDKELALTFAVDGEKSAKPPDFPIRVKLSFGDDPVITSKNPIMLFEDKWFRKIYPRGTKLYVRKIGKRFWIIGDGKIYKLKAPIRLKPHLDGVLEISNWENGREFRGILEILEDAKKLIAINELQLEDYIKGVAEEPNDAPIEKIKAISILARSYAQFYMVKDEKFPGKPYHLDDDPRNTQKYLGYSFEKRAPNIVKAAEATKAKVVTYEGELVKTPYFSQSDGRTRSGEEVFGWKNAPYLVSVPDPDCNGRELRGHGVGLSGCGAFAKAKRGESAEEIIKYYYQGVEIFDGK